MSSSDDSEICLYWGMGSPPCWSIQVMLEEKQIKSYKQQQVSFNKGEHKSAEILAINPRGELPSCVIGGAPVNESLAILLYLDEAYADQGTPLMPRDPKERAVLYHRLCEFYWNFSRRCYRGYVKFTNETPAEQRTTARVQQAKEEFFAEFDFWEGYLAARQKDSNGCFLFGNAFSMVDVVAFPWFAFMVALGLKLEPRFENVAKYFDFMKGRPSFQKFWPKYWDGSPNLEVLADIY